MFKPSEFRKSGKKIPAMSSISMSWLFHSLAAMLVFVAYLLWKITESKLAILIIVCCTTTFPVTVLISTMNFLCHVAILFRETYPSVISDVFYRAVKSTGAVLMILHGKIIHGYEVHGKENLPETSGALVVYHHALLPYDVFYLRSEQCLSGGITFGGVINRQLHKFIQGNSEVYDFYTERDRLVERLKKGHHCAVAPGGGLEATFSRDYELFWNGRIGFAEVAKECGVPVIPMFTVNSQQSMPITTFGFYEFFLGLYRRTKEYPFIPLFCFPAKLRIFLGKPLFCGATESPAEFAERIKAAIYDLRDEHQRQPGSIALAILERFGYKAFKREPRHERKTPDCLGAVTSGNQIKVKKTKNLE